MYDIKTHVFLLSVMVLVMQAVVPQHIMDELQVFTGQQIKVTFILNTEEQTYLNSSQLYFKFDNYTVPNAYINRPNSSSIVLCMEATIDMTGNLTYHARHRDEKIATIASFIVKKRPALPYNMTCIVLDWDMVKCTWKPSLSNRNQLTNRNQSVFVRTNGDVNSHSRTCTQSKSPFKSKCSIYKDKDGVKSCHLKLDSHITKHKKFYHVILRQNYVSNGIPIETVLHWTGNVTVKPGQVIDQKILVEELSASKISFEWRTPYNYNEDKKMTCNTTALSKFEDIIQIQEKRDGGKHKTVLSMEQGIKPYTEYNITITCARHNDHSWSDPVSLPATKTKQSVPGASPKTFPGGFEVESSGIRLYWQAIPPRLRNGKITSMRIQYYQINDSSNTLCPEPPINRECTTSSCKEINTDSDVTSVQIPGLNSESDYQIFIDAKTEKGYNLTICPSSMMVLQSNRKSLPKKFSIRYNSTGVYAWLPKLEDVDFYTLYWCKGDSKKAFRHASVEGNTFSNESQEVLIPFNHSISDVTLYTFALSMEKKNNPRDDEISCHSNCTDQGNSFTDMTSSGFLFIGCTYNANKDIAGPKKFKYDKDVYQKPHSLKVKWEHVNCTQTDQTDYIEEYVIEYWESNKQDSTYMQKVVRPTSSSYTIYDLQADTNYIVQIHGRNQWKVSQKYTLESKKVKREGLSQLSLIGVIVGAIVGLFLVIIGLCSIVRICYMKIQKIKKGLTIELPEMTSKPLLYQNGTRPVLKPDKTEPNRYLDSAVRDRMNYVNDTSTDGTKPSNGKVNGDSPADVNMNGYLPMLNVTNLCPVANKTSMATHELNINGYVDIPVGAHPPIMRNPHIYNPYMFDTAGKQACPEDLYKLLGLLNPVIESDPDKQRHMIDPIIEGDPICQSNDGYVDNGRNVINHGKRNIHDCPARSDDYVDNYSIEVKSTMKNYPECQKSNDHVNELISELDHGKVKDTKFLNPSQWGLNSAGYVVQNNPLSKATGQSKEDSTSNLVNNMKHIDDKSCESVSDEACLNNDQNISNGKCSNSDQNIENNNGTCLNGDHNSQVAPNYFQLNNAGYLVAKGKAEN